MEERNFCRDCKFRAGYRCGREEYRNEYIDPVSGEVSVWYTPCGTVRKGWDMKCPKFEKKPTLIQRLKEVFA